MKKNIFLLFILLSIVTITGYPSINNSANYYYPNLETSYKVGNVRQIGRASILLPIWQKEDQLLYFNAIGMMDNKNNQEGNFGIGYRRILNNNNKDIILGSFIHYDRKSSPNNNVFNQGTLGLELFSENLEARLNGYVSFSKIKELHSSHKYLSPRSNGANVFIGERSKRIVEAPLHGFDVEFGARIGQLPLSIYGGYYYFNRDGAERVQGPSGRLDIKLTNWLSLGGEVKYDEIRKLQYYVGLNLRFSNDKDNISPYSLRSKMTQMPLRDVDVVTVEDNKVYEDEHELYVIEKGGIEGGRMLAKKLGWDDSISAAGSSSASSSASSSSSSVKLNNVYIGLVADVIMLEGYQYPNEFNDSVIVGIHVPRDENDKITTVKYKKREIIGLETPLLNEITNSKVSHLIIDSGLGLVNKAYGKSEISNNENHGDIKREEECGIVYHTYDKTKVNNNINHGEVSGFNASGVVHTIWGDSQAVGNINHGEVSGLSASGVVFFSSNNTFATGNINHGEVSGTDASGVVNSVWDNSQVTGNINAGKVSGSGAKPIVTDIRGTAVKVSDNITLQEEDLASADLLKEKGVKLMDKGNINAPWFLGEGQDGEKMLIPSVVAKREMLKALKEINRLRDGGMMIRRNLLEGFPLPNEASVHIAEQSGAFSHLSNQTLNMIKDYSLKSTSKDNPRAKSKEEFFQMVVD